MNFVRIIFFMNIFITLLRFLTFLNLLRTVHSKSNSYFFYHTKPHNLSYSLTAFIASSVKWRKLIYWSDFIFLELLQSFISLFCIFLSFCPPTIFLYFFLFFIFSLQNVEFLSYICFYLLISKHTLFVLYCKTVSEELTLQQALFQVSSSFLLLFLSYLSFHCILFVI